MSAYEPTTAVNSGSGERYSLPDSGEPPAPDGAAGAAPLPLLDESGFSFLEVMVAITLLAIILTGLTGASFSLVRYSQISGGMVKRGAAAAEFSGYLTSAPWDSLPVASGCTTVAGADFPHDRCVTVVELSPNARRFTAIIVPANSAIPPDSSVVQRGKGGGGNPFHHP